MLAPIILSGGSGTRLWPLSQDQHPKQLLPLLSKLSLLQETVLRLDALKSEFLAPIIVCNEIHSAVIQEQLQAIDRAKVRLIVEPEGRNTAPAAAVAALVLENLYPGESHTLLVLPADHLIGRPDEFSAAVAVALRAAERGSLVSFGVIPDGPETGYGYIKRGAGTGEIFDVEAFVEKPNLERAKVYVDSGDYYWNSGMFLFKGASYLAELESFAPGISICSQRSVEASVHRGEVIELGQDAFLECPGNSIDYAVMEQTANASVVPLDADWSDVGSWEALHDVCDTDSDGNVTLGKVVALDCRGSYLRAEGRVLAAIGLDDFVVVGNADGLLVAPMASSQRVKEAAGLLRAAANQEAAPSSIAPTDKFQMQQLVLNSGDSIDAQSRLSGVEHWIVSSGRARFVIENESTELAAGDATVIGSGALYKVENLMDEPLELVVVRIFIQ